MKSFLLSSFFVFSVWASAQSDFVFTWVTNNSSFQAIMSINNYGRDTAQLTLVATRADNGNGTPTETVNLTLAPLEQVVMTASQLFPNMGEGSGYSVAVTSTTSDVTGALVVNSTGTASGSSPSQADVIDRSNASQIIAFNYLPLEGGFSAPVIHNAGNADTTVTYHAYQNGQQVDSVMRPIAVGKPYAELATDLFPNLNGDIYVVAEADQPLMGLAFLFNDVLEPSMSTARNLSFVPKEQTQATVSYVAMIQPIYERSCGGGACHIISSAGGLNLSAANSYANTVGQAALQNSSMSLITPNNPDQSYLYQKVLPGGNFFNSPMPRGRPPLSEAERNLILTWINEGAENN